MVSPDPGAETPGGDTDCYKSSPSPSSRPLAPPPMSWSTRSRHATGVNPVPTLLAMMRHFSLS